MAWCSRSELSLEPDYKSGSATGSSLCTVSIEVFFALASSVVLKLATLSLTDSIYLARALTCRLSGRMYRGTCLRLSWPLLSLFVAVYFLPVEGSDIFCWPPSLALLASALDGVVAAGAVLAWL